ncbi:nucleotidyltransferase family protein [Halomonas daqiaonensis]|uniref:Molybdenum cofactor cytidylyltransferase n=1 Tax=Halomonas daqiaonensis TaxID=650850 RepID=A0A1H7IVV7_9GAMM|nr:nucleotidyltransferase family protein [Halomonas daqiaonensis]SEK65780.1 molybdenum cofactor cytidylyltransferase [Halomonas daqiaonensis]
MASEPVVALVMAAGRSRRFAGGDKRLAVLPDGRCLLSSSCALASDVFADVRVVLREEDDPLALGLIDPALRIIRAPRGDQGLGASLADAFGALGRDPALVNCRAAAVLLGDMPRIDPGTLQRLEAAAERDSILRPCQGGRPGHPVLFGRDFWSALEGLGGDTGGRPVLCRYPASLRTLAVADPGIHRDIDTAEALAALER